MPLPPNVSCFSKIQIGFTFLVAAHPGSPGKKGPLNGCVCVLPVSSWVVKCKTCHTQHSSVMHQLYCHLLTGDSPNEQGLQRRRKENYTLLHYYLLIISTNIFIQHLLYLIINKDNWVTFHSAFSALTLLAEWQEGHPACKNWVLGAGMVICLERVADLHMSQLMPLPLTVSCFSKIHIGFTFLVPASPGNRAVWVWKILLSVTAERKQCSFH